MQRYQQATLTLRRPGTDERMVAVACVVLLVIGVGAVAPFAATPMADLAPLLPAYATAILACDLIAATLLLSHYAALGAPAFLALAAAYLFNGLTAIAWVASFPGVFTPDGLLGGDLQTTAVIAAFRRLAFPIGVVTYAILRLQGPTLETWRPPSSRRAVAVVAASVLAALLAAWAGVGLSASAPALMASPSVPTAAWDVVLWASVALTMAAAVAVARLRPFSMLDLWLLVTLAALLVEIVLLGILADGVRFNLGWWAGRAFGLAAVAVVALALLIETASLTARSVTTLMAEVQARRAREATLEALGAAIAHELNQPLAAIVTSAEAAVRWLDRPEPELAQTRRRLAAIANDGARAGRVLAGLRRSFGRRAPRDESVEAGPLLASVAALVQEIAAAAGVRVLVDAGAAGGAVVRGDADQLRQALLNLAANAIEAMAQTTGAPRALAIDARTDADSVVLSVADTGPGLPKALVEQGFEPFRSGKPQGMGLGMMISRTIVEAHGGKIAATNRPGGGALFEIALPRERPDV